LQSPKPELPKNVPPRLNYQVARWQGAEGTEVRQVQRLIFDDREPVGLEHQWHSADQDLLQRGVSNEEQELELLDLAVGRMEVDRQRKIATFALREQTRGAVYRCRIRAREQVEGWVAPEVAPFDVTSFSNSIGFAPASDEKLATNINDSTPMTSRVTDGRNGMTASPFSVTSGLPARTAEVV
jgi:hypothetical protein